MSQHELHLMHYKLIALGSLAQFSLQRLLRCLSLKSVTINKDDNDTKDDKAGKAISKVLTLANKNKVKKLSNLFTETSNTEVIYKDFKKNALNEKINAALLDTSSLADILLKIDTFEVSYPINRKSVPCSGHTSRLNCCSSCVNQKHLCGKCKQERCNNKCCENNSICSHPCVTCGTDAHDCLNNNYVCCNSCRLCMKCTLAKLTLSNWHDLVEKLINGELINVCNTLLLRISISIIKSFRNLTSHLTTEKCKAMDNGSFTDSKIPKFCKSWVSTQNVYEFAIVHVLNYLKSEDTDFTYMEFTKQMEYIRNVTTATNHTYLHVFKDAINKYLELENIFNNKPNNIKVSEKSIKVVVGFELGKTIKFNLQDFEEYDKIFKKATESYFQNKTGKSYVTGKLVGREPQMDADSKTLFLGFKISFLSEDMDLRDYEVFFGNKAKELWESLKKQLEKTLPAGTVILLDKWDSGSIIIEFGILKRFNEVWKESEEEEIEKRMSNFTKEIELSGDLSQCVVTFERRRRKTLKDRSPTSLRLVYRLNASSEDVAQIFDNFDENSFIGCLEFFLSNLEEKVTVTGKKLHF